MDDTVQICCTRCRNVFRDRARRVQSGYSRQCPGCEVVLFFDDTSPDKNIKRALSSARDVRKVLRQQELAGPRQATPTPSRRRSY
ncbi:hypothetical protein [Bradyrhizobium sp.]|uniref:hypothetical protein n=1 Tax=Bradyrhizobium sp. TaxID=376 RepID=UPI0025BE3A18|nr:hypothetical protein [Bradyrhizobium sp.]